MQEDDSLASYTSPNIRGAADDDDGDYESPYDADGSNDESKDKYKVELDDTPIPEEEIEYRSTEVKKQDNDKLFVKKHRDEAEERRLKHEQDLKDEEVIKRLNDLAKKRKTLRKQEAEQQKLADQRVKKEKKAEKHIERRKEARSRFRKVLDFFFKGAHKFITIPVILLILAVIGNSVAYRFIIIPSRIAFKENTTAEKMFNDTEMYDKYYYIEETASHMLGREMEIDDVLDFIENEINEEQNEDMKIMLRIMYYQFYGTEKDLDEGINKMLELDNDSLKSFVKENLYKQLSYLYILKHDNEKSDYYYSKAEEYK